MINANELRIGNFLQIGNNFGRVNSIIKIKDNEFELYFDENQEYNHWFNAEPIPLTEEWLLRLGLKKSLDEYELKFYLGAISFELPSLNCSLCAGEYVEGSSAELAEIKYVHQLQNLYFALTGEELQLKESVLQPDNKPESEESYNERKRLYSCDNIGGGECPA